MTTDRITIDAEARPGRDEGSMTLKERDLLRELSAGIRAMRDHAEGRIELRTTRLSPLGTEVKTTRRLPPRLRRRLRRGSVTY
jgi:hypothetical protein